MADPQNERTSSRSGGAARPSSAADGGLDDRATAKAADLKNRATDKAEELQSKAKGAAQDLKREAEERIERRTSQGAERLDSIVRALHSAADQLSGDGERWLANYARQAAGQLDRMSGYLRDEDAPSMLSDLEKMARSNPGTFLGTSFAAGVAAGRFLRSSAPTQDTERTAGTNAARSTTRTSFATGSSTTAGDAFDDLGGARTGGSAMASHTAGGVTARGSRGTDDARRTDGTA